MPVPVMTIITAMDAGLTMGLRIYDALSARQEAVTYTPEEQAILDQWTARLQERARNLYRPDPKLLSGEEPRTS